MKNTKVQPYLFVFLVSPVLGLFVALRNFGNKYARYIVILFSGIFGFTMYLRPGRDSYSHAMKFEEMAGQDFSYLWEIILDVLTFNFAIAADIYDITLGFTVSRFTSDPSWFFLVAGLIYGYFYVNGMRLVFKDVKVWHFSLILLGTLFAFWLTFNGFNSIRMWTGAWVFFNGTYLYLTHYKKRYLYLILLSPLIHFSYFLIVIPFFIYYFIGNKIKVYSIILALSFFFTIELTQFQNLAEFSGPIAEQRFESYTGERFLGDRQQTTDTRFYAQYYNTAVRIFVMYLFLYALIFWGFIFKKRLYNIDKFQLSLAGICILLLAFSNLTASIPSLSGRSNIVFVLFALAFFIRFVSMNNIRKNLIINIIGPFVVVLHVLTKLNILTTYMLFHVLISPLLYPFFAVENFTIRDFIDNILDLIL